MVCSVIFLSACDDYLLLKFQSDIMFVDHALELMRTILEYQGVEDPTNILLVSSELLKNAVVHGNQNDSSKDVLLRLTRMQQGRVRLEIEDDGKGVVHRGNVSDLTQKDSPIGAARHGYSIISNLSEKILFNEIGNRVTVFLDT